VSEKAEWRTGGSVVVAGRPVGGGRAGGWSSWLTAEPSSRHEEVLYSPHCGGEVSLNQRSSICAEQQPTVASVISAFAAAGSVADRLHRRTARLVVSAAAAAAVLDDGWASAIVDATSHAGMARSSLGRASPSPSSSTRRLRGRLLVRGWTMAAAGWQFGRRLGECGRSRNLSCFAF